tara:strand:- start:9565 stop:10413 length:849 start_codon:yes stop_codon:yes gene_type:complete
MVNTKRKHKNYKYKETAKGILTSKIRNNIKPFTFNKLKQNLYRLQENINILESKEYNSDSKKQKNLKKIVKLLEEFSYLYNSIYNLTEFNNLHENDEFMQFIQSTIQSCGRVINIIAVIYINFLNDNDIVRLKQIRDEIRIRYFIDSIDENSLDIDNLNQACTEYYEHGNIEGLRLIIEDQNILHDILYRINQDVQIITINNKIDEFDKWTYFIRNSEENDSINYEPKEYLRVLINTKIFLYKNFLSKKITRLLPVPLLRLTTNRTRQPTRITTSRRIISII